MREAAGVMLIFQGIGLPAGTTGQLLAFLYLAGVPFDSNTTAYVTTVALVLTALIILSGVSALQRASWGLALAGAILSVLLTLSAGIIFALLALVPVAFLVATRGEFRVAESSLPSGFEPVDDDT